MDITFMKLALEQAIVSSQNGDVPFGAVIVCGDEVIAVAENTELRDHDVTKHAEVKVIAAASKVHGRDLSDCTIYSTVEPCTMCSGAILYACLSRIVYGVTREDLPHLFRARNIRLHHLAEDYRHAPEVVSGVLKQETIAAFDAYHQPFRVAAGLSSAAAVPAVAPDFA